MKLYHYLEENSILNNGCKWNKILVVDDLAFNLIAIELMIKKKFNLQIDKAFSGEEAIEKVKQKLNNKCWGSYKLILMDYYMPPGINGGEASKKIKEILKLERGSHIAWLTSQKEGDFDFNENMKNFDQCFSKPILPVEIGDLITHLITELE